MNKLPEAMVDSLTGISGFDREEFISIHASGEQVTSIRLNPAKGSVANSHLPIAGSIPWTENGFYLSERPSFTFDPFFHAGCYYVQEASSMFLEQALRQTVDLSKPLKVLDLCAAPGGKSIHIQSLISKNSLLVSNEVIRSRANILKDNIIKWGAQNVVVTNNDPKDFSILENYFDVIVVDAPCSGSGLFRRDPDAIDEWSENNVTLCSQRQQRILADVWPALKKDGILIYSTCSYSKEEDEDIMDWMSRELAISNRQLAIVKEWGIVPTKSVNKMEGYRFWPDKVKGEGLFLSVFQKTGGDDAANIKAKKTPGKASKADIAIVSKWMEIKDQEFIRHANTIYAWPEQLADDFALLLEKLRVIYSGILVGELVRDKLIPDHALAMSRIVAENIPKTALTREQAIQYLQRKDLQLEATVKGWQLVTYQGQALGWINALVNRINNYYPKELRILKDS